MRSARPPGGMARRAGEFVVGGHVADLEYPGLGVQPVRTHAFGVAGQFEDLRHLRLCHERSPALHPQQPALDNQFGQCLPDGRPRCRVPLGEFTFRRNRASLRHRPCQLEQLPLHRVVLGDSRVLPAGSTTSGLIAASGSAVPPAASPCRRRRPRPGRAPAASVERSRSVFSLRALGGVRSLGTDGGHGAANRVQISIGQVGRAASRKPPRLGLPTAL